MHGGAPGTREFSLLSPATATPGAQALLLTGGSAFGLAAADGAVAWLDERGLGYETPVARVPLVTAAVVFDLGLGDPGARPGAADGYAACAAAGAGVERGSVGAGTGCTAGNLLGPGSRTKTGLGAASLRAGDAVLAAVAVANPLGDVRAADGRVLAGVWRDGSYVRTIDLLLEGVTVPPGATGGRTGTTLVCLLTDARLSKTQAWLTARAASAGVARAVEPSATAFDGDLVTCMATGRVRRRPVRGVLAGGGGRRGGDPRRRALRHGRARLPGGARPYGLNADFPRIWRRTGLYPLGRGSPARSVVRRPGTQRARAHPRDRVRALQPPRHPRGRRRHGDRARPASRR